MTQPRIDSDFSMPSGQYLDRWWKESGYKPDAVPKRRAPDEDPRGEVAYHRAFAEAAKIHPPRLPDPFLFPNSPTARKCLQQRDEKLFPSRRPDQIQPGTPTSAMQPPYPARQFDSLPSPRDDIYRHSHASSNASQPEPTAYPGRFQSSEHSRHVSSGSTGPEDRRTYPTGQAPATLEPKMDAPIGPPRMIR
ncbi:hypothetical protein PV10_01123 [Exophiala mesophila]|uniref:Uncharacterized protein n=1 Tax=Exophiala mesophila TaxID=212818 RepID=A0A0D1ZRY5_EXOME|nr:uncharacterized protein PV10_01123 [Exophiala mesophila]KIV97362.1 hypothetical protein PV10_01123 [Exophiala mesophila]